MIAASAAEAGLQRLEGTVNSFVREAGATMAQVEAQYLSAERAGASKDALAAAVNRGVTSPPHSDPHRVVEIKARFLQ